jgi:hypothetical protein
MNLPGLVQKTPRKRLLEPHYGKPAVICQCEKRTMPDRRSFESPNAKTFFVRETVPIQYKKFHAFIFTL